MKIGKMLQTSVCWS